MTSAGRSPRGIARPKGQKTTASNQRTLNALTEDIEMGRSVQAV
jgi:hypothetical protein